MTRRIDMSEYRATVKVGGGFTINLGQYESARIDAGVEIQGERDKLPELWKEAEKEVKQQLEAQVKALREQLDDKHTLMGMPKGATFK